MYRVRWFLEHTECTATVRTMRQIDCGSLGAAVRFVAELRVEGYGDVRLMAIV